jgi:hypothetical protein
VGVQVAARNMLGATVTLIALAPLGGCGSSSHRRPVSAAPGTRSSSSSGSATHLAAFTDCMAKAGLQPTLVPSDRAVRAVARQPGYEGVRAFTDSAGRRVAVAFFATPGQTEAAQNATLLLAPGSGHVAAAARAAIVWVNYSGGTALDRKIADCGGSPAK